MNTQKLIILAAATTLTIPSASAAVTLSKNIRGATTWDAFTVATEPSNSTLSPFYTIKQDNTIGYGQSFTTTAGGNVDAISFGVTRMYAGRAGMVTVYQLFGGDGSTPDANPTRFRVGNASWVSAAITSFTFDTTSVNINNSGDGNNMFTFSLSGADQFAVANGATYLISLTGTGATNDDLVLWDKLDAGTYAGGLAGAADGSNTAAARDMLLAVNIVPEPSTALLGGLGLLGFLARRRR